MIKLYTLPNCGICNMVKTKLTQKGIAFEEHNFEEIVPLLHTDRAPVVYISSNNTEEYILSPTKINEWISKL